MDHLSTRHHAGKAELVTSRHINVPPRRVHLFLLGQRLRAKPSTLQRARQARTLVNGTDEFIRSRYLGSMGRDDLQLCQRLDRLLYLVMELLRECFEAFGYVHAANTFQPS